MQVSDKTLSEGLKINAQIRAHKNAVDKLAADAKVDPTVANAALDIDNNPANDSAHAKAIQAAANAYKTTKADSVIWAKSFLGGPSNATAAHDAAVAAARAAGAGPNDVPNLVKAAEKIAQAQK